MPNRHLIEEVLKHYSVAVIDKIYRNEILTFLAKIYQRACSLIFFFVTVQDLVNFCIKFQICTCHYAENELFFSTSYKLNVLINLTKSLNCAIFFYFLILYGCICLLVKFSSTNLSLNNIDVLVVSVVRAHQLAIPFWPFDALPTGGRSGNIPSLGQIKIGGCQNFRPRWGTPPPREQDQPDRTGLHVRVFAVKTTLPVASVLLGQLLLHRHAVQEEAVWEQGRTRRDFRNS